MTTFDIQEQLRTGHPTPPRNPMRTIAIILLTLVFIAFLLAFTGCSTTTVRTVTTDKEGRVTDVTTTTKATDPAALALAGVAITAYAPPRALYVREEKADHDMRRLLRGWRGPAAVAATGPITAAEISNRYRKP